MGSTRGSDKLAGSCCLPRFRVRAPCIADILMQYSFTAGYLDVGASADCDFVGVSTNHSAIPYRALWRVREEGVGAADTVTNK